MTANPKRTRVLHLIFLGLALLAAWLVVLLNDEAGYPAWVAWSGIGVTLGMVAVLLRSYITRRGLGGIVAALSIISLVLTVITMIVLLFLWS